MDKPWPREWCDDSGQPLTGTMILHLQRQKQKIKFNIIGGEIPELEEIKFRLFPYSAPNRLYGSYMNEHGEAV